MIELIGNKKSIQNIFKIYIYVLTGTTIIPYLS